ncbi:STAS domain-containing protein [Mycobacterium aquaticum]|uniref:Accessory protein NosL n=1 Tax=Mycobacterium aquaticum TaxID=1927124 RepID=A0A1X0ACW2_9MYCO|nr:STAS domain-containing protein [Mycobacterium aquaticum]ORA27852.1 accessory protein NosL [Mycobacterium aquaticum]
MSIVNVPPFPPGTRSDRRGDPMACFGTRWVRPSTALVTVGGELDAANARQFAEYAMGHISRSKELILDLQSVQFFAVSCVPALHNLNMRCAREGVGWALVPSPAVLRVLRICDPDEQLPTAPTIKTALSWLRNGFSSSGSYRSIATNAIFAV